VAVPNRKSSLSADERPSDQGGGEGERLDHRHDPDDLRRLDRLQPKLAASGASAGFVRWVIGLDVDPLITVVGLIVIVFVLGLFIDAISIMLITVPLFMPVVQAIGMDPLWFALLVLIALEMGALTPPMGLQLFVLKGVQPELEMSSIFRSVWPVVVMMWLCIGIFVLVPDLAYILVIR
jgi:TRAP-type C4-dicarboxylate transport system permease large subunit